MASDSIVDSSRTRVILIAVGGATCSGKTTLAKYLRSTLPGSFIIHQDDFAPAQELIPIHPVYKVQDWDDAPSAIDWDIFFRFVSRVKEEGVLPDHPSHDHLNSQLDNAFVPPEMKAFWRRRFQHLVDCSLENGTRVVFAMLDGFLLYWDKRLIKTIDVPLFLRVSYDTLRDRRIKRSGYHTAVQFNLEGDFWQDPPGYWENIVYPAYLRAHAEMFMEGDVENGESSEKVPGLVLIDGESNDMAQIFDQACRAIEEHL